MDHVGWLSPGDFHTFYKKVTFKRKEYHHTAICAFCCCGFRLRILYKSQDVNFCIFAVFIFAQGFSAKVAMTGVLDDHWPDTFFAFSHRDSLQKWRWQGSWSIVARMHYLRSRTGILFKSRDQSSLQSILYFHRSVTNSSYIIRSCTHFRRWVMLASRWRLRIL